MPGMSGQALRLGGRTCSLLLRGVMALFLVAGLGVSALAWRLAEGPLHIPALTRLVEHALAQSGLQQSIQVADIVLAWDGFRRGGGSPLEIRVTGVQVFDDAGSLRQELPEIGVSLAFARLLRGEIALRASCWSVGRTAASPSPWAGSPGLSRRMARAGMCCRTWWAAATPPAR
jgi:hypothetical protein